MGVPTFALNSLDSVAVGLLILWRVPCVVCECFHSGHGRTTVMITEYFLCPDSTEGHTVLGSLHEMRERRLH